ncbi:MAG: hypothetical protein C5B58_13665 [Acidobacteria bacterium]|nr:MAG: hypothetical protein C5B58_13665 [Acidobacteriota bacterium]
MRSSLAKKAPPIPSLAQRIEALKEEVEEALSALAEEHRPKREDGAVPAGVIRQLWMARAGGNVFEAYLIAVKEFPQ